MRTKREAVQEIANTATSSHVVDAAQAALKEGTEQALDRAIHETKSCGQTLHVINIANEQLGYPPNHTD